LTQEFCKKLDSALLFFIKKSCLEVRKVRGLKYVANRLFFFVITLFFALTINFVLPRLMPGDPAERILSRFGPNVDEKL